MLEIITSSQHRPNDFFNRRRTISKIGGAGRSGTQVQAPDNRIRIWRQSIAHIENFRRQTVTGLQPRYRRPRLGSIGAGDYRRAAERGRGKTPRVCGRP